MSDVMRAAAVLLFLRAVQVRGGDVDAYDDRRVSVRLCQPGNHPDLLPTQAGAVVVVVGS